MKSIYSFLTVFCMVFSNAQHTYHLEWTSFLGPQVSTWQARFSHNELRIRTHYLDDMGQSTQNTAYYNQFVIPTGGTGVNNSSYDNYSIIKFDHATGNVNDAQYNSDIEVYYAPQTRNTYRIRFATSASPLPYNTWLPQHPNPSLNLAILSKYNAQNQLEWETYLPEDNGMVFLNRRGLGEGDRFTEDEDGNLYILYSTTNATLGTPNAWYSTPGITPSQNLHPYIAKLNPQGQLQWLTYTRKSVKDISVHNNKVGIILHYLHYLPDPDNISTPGALQEDPSDYGIVVLDENNGQQVWGTYYGDNRTTLHRIFVTQNSVVVLGYDGTGYGNTYFATPNAVKPVSAYRDYFISNFSPNSGHRNWSTYMGTNGNEFPTGVAGLYGSKTKERMDVRNNKIAYVSDYVANATNNIATANAHLSTPRPYYFTILDEGTGSVLTTSYLGPAVFGTGDQDKFGVHHCVLGENGLYILGGSSGQAGITTSNAAYPTVVPPPNYHFYSTRFKPPYAGFVMKYTNIDALSTKEINMNKEVDFQLYNNPNYGVFSLELSEGMKFPIQISVHDASGKLVHNASFSKDLPEFFDLREKTTEGMYWVTVKGGDGKTSVKTMMRK